MTLMFKELAELLAERYDEVTLIDILGITSQDIVERFSDIIEEKYDQLSEELEEDELE